MNRITSITSTADGVTAITYDKRSQVTAADHASPRSDESYGYDDNGNRTGGSYSVGTNNQTTADGTYSYTYDKEGNRTRRTKTSDSSYEDYTWDHRNRLTKVTFKNSCGTELKNVEYAYDVFNRLIRRKYDADGPGSGAATNLFLVGYDGINPTLGFDGTAQADVSNRFLWGPQVDQLFADEQVTNPTSAGNTLWPLGDQVGTLRDIADYNGTAYTVTNHRTYDSFGNLTAESQSSVDEIFANTGKFFDEVTKLSNHLNRWLDPGLGKWVSEDPIGFNGKDTNLARYVSNSSTKFTDIQGLDISWGPSNGVGNEASPFGIIPTPGLGSEISDFSGEGDIISLLNTLSVSDIQSVWPPSLEWQPEWLPGALLRTERIVNRLKQEFGQTAADGPILLGIPKAYVDRLGGRKTDGPCESWVDEVLSRLEPNVVNRGIILQEVIWQYQHPESNRFPTKTHTARLQSLQTRGNGARNAKSRER